MTNEQFARWNTLLNDCKGSNHSINVGSKVARKLILSIDEDLHKKDAIIQAQKELITWIEWQVDEWGLASRRKYEQLIKRIEEAKK